MKKYWAIRKDAEAVSPVIATILMVAITVVLAAVLYVMVLGFGGTSTTTPAATYSKVPISGGQQINIVSLTKTDVAWDQIKVQLSDGTRMTLDHSQRLLLEGYAHTKGGRLLPLDYRPRVWFNPDLETSRFLIPGLIGFILVLTAVISTSLTVVREKERGTMEQLMVSPLRPVHIILGKTIPYLLISLLAATIILVIGSVLFGVEIRRSILVLYGGILLIILGALGQGLISSTVTDSEQVAFLISVLSSLLPSFLLSGFVFPISNMPIVLQALSNIAVNKFFLVVVRGVMLRGAGLDVLWPQFLYMAVFAAITLGVSSRRMQKRSL